MAEKKESKWKFYWQARWQAAFTAMYLVVALYLCFFYIGNIWNAFAFAYYTFLSSAAMLGLEFAFWGVIFEISTVVPFLAAFYSIFLLPKIWRSEYRHSQKTALTFLTIIIIPMIIIIADTLARFALQTDVLREFVNLHKIL